MFELTSKRRAALQAVLMDRSDVALCYLALTLLRGALSEHGGPGPGTLAKITGSRPALAEVAAKGNAAALVAQRKADLPARLPVTRGDWLAWLQGQPQAVVLELLAFCVASTLDATQTREGPAPEFATLAQAVQLDMADWWQARGRQLLRAGVQGVGVAGGGRGGRCAGGGAAGEAEQGRHGRGC
ncbi:hypothetical protein GTP55_13135 [Duganella sp. FT109W]|uniref:Uncharacterized protein n=1 Tax=Duganella margarita TaxID=2692170 RepID=A0ABW9WHP8_9BURK|nr:hypothetical protein [Duganella margarita]MYN40320.1 hypothetical protein [Duganella margarita]